MNSTASDQRLAVASYRITTDRDFYITAFERWRRQRRIHGVFVAIRWIGTIVIGASVIMALVRGFWIPAASISVLILFFWASPYLDHMRVAYRTRRSPWFGKTGTLSLDDAGIHYDSPDEKYLGPWSCCTSAVRYSDGWLLQHGPTGYRWLADANAVDASTIDAAKDVIERHVAEIKHKT